MATSPDTLKTSRPPRAKQFEDQSTITKPADGFRPQPASPSNRADPARLGVRLYTEDQVAEMLQVSRSQLRKWRMGWSRGVCDGPPFKRIGRLIRYTEVGLQAYIDAA